MKYFKQYLDESSNIDKIKKLYNEYKELEYGYNGKTKRDNFSSGEKRSETIKFNKLKNAILDAGLNLEDTLWKLINKPNELK